ncbi:MAG TPA: hypothetical protein VI612_01405 [Candidatus Nanoarchaeia archaeon]|nr:hypothetical protein [Candidatus Nanoarchaeia archaeon]
MELSEIKTEIVHHWNTRKTEGANVKEKLADYAANRQGGTELHTLQHINQLADSLKIKKISTLSVKVHDRIEGEDLGVCQLCGQHGLKKATTISFAINGKSKPGARFLVGDNCLERTAHWVEGIRHKDYENFKDDQRESQETEKAETVEIPIGMLSRKIVRLLKEQKFDLDRKIATYAVQDVQKQMLRGDFTGLERRIDAGEFRAMSNWIAAKRKAEEIEDPVILYAASLLPENAGKLTPELATAILLYQWQERPLKAAGEIGDIKDDILYLAGLPKNSPVIKEHGKVNLGKRVKPVKLWKKAKWKKATLGELLEKDSITKSQARAIRLAIPRLQERREYHNRTTMDSYCDDREFNKIMQNLQERVKKYNSEKTDALRNKRHSLECPWQQDSYKIMRKFFRHARRVQRLQPDATLREVLATNFGMREAAATARTLYIEGRKLYLAEAIGQKILRDKYTTAKEAPALEKLIKKLTQSAIEFENLPQHTREHLRKAGIKQYEAFKKDVEHILKAREYGILPAEYQTDWLERTKAFAENYQKAPETIKQIKHIRMLEESTLEFKLTNVNADDGAHATRKDQARFSAKTYEGKKYFTPEQQKAIAAVFNWLPEEFRNLNGAGLQKVKQALERVQEFYRENNVYNNENVVRKPGYYEVVTSFLFFNREKIKQIKGPQSYIPLGWILARDEEIRKFRENEEQSNYKRLTEELKSKVRELAKPEAKEASFNNQYNRLDVLFGESVEDILAKENVVITRHMAEMINNLYGKLKS